MINLTAIRTPIQLYRIRDMSGVPFMQSVDWDDFWRARRAGELEFIQGHLSRRSIIEEMPVEAQTRAAANLKKYQSL